MVKAEVIIDSRADAVYDKQTREFDLVRGADGVTITLDAFQDVERIILTMSVSKTGLVRVMRTTNLGTTVLMEEQRLGST